MPYRIWRHHLLPVGIYRGSKMSWKCRIRRLFCVKYNAVLHYAVNLHMHSWWPKEVTFVNQKLTRSEWLPPHSDNFSHFRHLSCDWAALILHTHTAWNLSRNFHFSTFFREILLKFGTCILSQIGDGHWGLHAKLKFMINVVRLQLVPLDG